MLASFWSELISEWMGEEEEKEEVIVSRGGVPQREYLYPQVFTRFFFCGERGVNKSHTKNVKVKLSILLTTSGSINYLQRLEYPLRRQTL